MKLHSAADILSSGIEESVNYYQFPREHHRSIRINNITKRIMKEIKLEKSA